MEPKELEAKERAETCPECGKPIIWYRNRTPLHRDFDGYKTGPNGLHPVPLPDKKGEL